MTPVPHKNDARIKELSLQLDAIWDQMSGKCIDKKIEELFEATMQEQERLIRQVLIDRGIVKEK